MAPRNLRSDLPTMQQWKERQKAAIVRRYIEDGHTEEAARVLADIDIRNQ